MIAKAHSQGTALSGCLISLISQAESSHTDRKDLWGLLTFYRNDVDESLITDKIYTSMITYYMENEAAFGFLDKDGSPKNFIELGTEEHAQIKETMAKEVEASDEATNRIRSRVAQLIRSYKVPKDYREYQERRSAGAN